MLRDSLRSKTGEAIEKIEKDKLKIKREQEKKFQEKVNNLYREAIRCMSNAADRGKYSAVFKYDNPLNIKKDGIGQPAYKEVNARGINPSYWNPVRSIYYLWQDISDEATLVMCKKLIQQDIDITVVMVKDNVCYGYDDGIDAYRLCFSWK